MKKLPNIISILILTLITTIMWISFTIYRAFTAQPTPSVKKEISQPLVPTLDKTAMDAIEASVFLDSSQIPENVVTQVAPNAKTIIVTTPLPSATPIPTTQPESTPSSTPTPTP